MTFKRFISGLPLLLLVSVVSAQNGIDPAQRHALIQEMAKGTTFVSNGRTYVVLPQARAAGMQESETHVQSVKRLGVSPSELLETKGHFVLYRSARTAPAAVQGEGEAPNYPVAMNAATERLAVMPGTVRVRFAAAMDAEALGADHGLTLHRAFPHLNIAYYRLPPGVEIPTAAKALAADKRVQSAEPEVIEYFRQLK
jgi:hypothetical protein